MDKDGFGSSVLWNIRSDISLDDLVLSVYNWGYLQVDHVIWRSIALLVWIGIWKKLGIYRVPTDPVRWSCRGFVFIWRALMLNWILWTKNDFKVSHRKQVNYPSNMKLVTSLKNF